MYALQHANELKIPALIMHGEDDKITSEPASAEFAKRSSLMSEYKSWPGMYHEIHNEPDNESVYAYSLNWILRKLNK
jgi:alpha-beta hydrolase superfamily lysophospholipase